MKLSSKTKSIIKSYLRGVIVACLPILAMNETDPKVYLYAVLAGVISPALRAADKKDHAFGLVADAVDAKVKAKK
jgi:hypothetical protein